MGRTSAAVVSGLECYRLTIGTTEHSVIGHSDPGIPSAGSVFPPAAEPLRARRRFPLAWTGGNFQAARRAALCCASPRSEQGKLEKNKERNAGIRLVTVVPLSSHLRRAASPPLSHIS